ncbi:Argonaute 3 RISC catalytic component [Paragonimus heterotremus]|uniref:Argonaute 3 RISC catalytic component n=1 Tax=Paragonimus heterotremus TaxID=100268 RepID=A0A8J4SP59_9TREM|nr:Argonaute 3 RISC catalytic component [Paragonimus heterotremus]
MLVLFRLPKRTLYDGGHIIFAEHAISGVTTNGCSRTLNIPDPLESGSLILTYRILETQTISTGDILDYLNNPDATTISMPQDAIRVLDCFFKTFFKEFSLESLGKMALFEKDPTQKFQQKLFGVHKGYLASVRPQWKVRINLDMTFKAFLIAGNLADVLYDKYGDDICNRAQQMLDDIKGIRVQTNKQYKEKTSHVRRFTVHGISREPASKLIISELKQSVKDYFETKYGLKLTYDLPCIKIKSSREEYMPMELLDIMPFQSPNPRKYDIASDIIRVAAKPPQLRFKEIQDFLKLVLSKKQSFLQTSSVKIHDQPVTVVGRVLKTPVANFGGTDCSLTRGKWIVKSFHTQAFKGKPILGAIFSVPPHRNGTWARGVVLQQLPNVARGYGISFELRDCGDLYPAAMLAQLKALPAKGFDIAILVLLDDFNYGEIKRLSDIRFGIRTQCVRDRTLKKPNVMQNLLLKINGKLGGTNWILPELTHNHPGDRFMVFGADVTHPSPTQAQELRKSVAAVTGSISLDLMRYAAVVRQQATTRSADRVIREIIDQMESMMEELLKCYIRKHDFPTKLIFYRDGVSEGQFQTVLTEELRAIQNACTKLRPDYQPAITYIVVQKRHHIRFMPEKPDPRNRTGNVDPGTVVDRDVTHHREFDFYLCSAEGIQGTSKPAKYHVLYDDSNWSSDALQAFTFYLCHAYMRCSRSVSYPAPTYYSHLTAFRARDWLNGIQNLKGILEDERFCVHSSQVEGMFFL